VCETLAFDVCIRVIAAFVVYIPSHILFEALIDIKQFNDCCIVGMVCFLFFLCLSRFIINRWLSQLCHLSIVPSKEKVVNDIGITELHSLAMLFSFHFHLEDVYTKRNWLLLRLSLIAVRSSVIAIMNIDLPI
jgi:hypothetical protein